ncbi:MAG: hypothetical protein ACK5NT_02515 [Pyrinomonadaceae bacterium]
MIDIGINTGVVKPFECLKEGLNLIKPHYPIVLAVTFVGMLVAGFVPFGIAIGAVFCGIYATLFRILDGDEPHFEDLFIGLKYFVPSLVATLILVVPSIFLGIIFSIPAVMIWARVVQDPNLTPNEIFGYSGFLIAETLIAVIILGFLQAFLFFAYPLIVEYNLGGWDAFSLSARGVWKNLGGVAGFIVLECIIGLIGGLLCFIGVYLVMPIFFAGALVAYKKVFDRSNLVN